jgi:transposase
MSHCEIPQDSINSQDGPLATAATRYTEEVRGCAVRMVRQHLHEYSSERAAVAATAAKIGCTTETLRRWIVQSQRDSGGEADLRSRVLRWHSSTVRFRKRQGTLTSLARSTNLSVYELRRVLKGRTEGLSLSAQQREDIRRWESRRRRYHKAHATATALAESLGISRSTLFLCIQKKGIYGTTERSDARGEGGSSRGGQKAGQHDVTSALLRTWRRVPMDDA